LAGAAHATSSTALKALGCLAERQGVGAAPSGGPRQHGPRCPARVQGWRHQAAGRPQRCLSSSLAPRLDRSFEGLVACRAQYYHSTSSPGVLGARAARAHNVRPRLQRGRNGGGPGTTQRARRHRRRHAPGRRCRQKVRGKRALRCLLCRKPSRFSWLAPLCPLVAPRQDVCLARATC